ncbi:MAG: hypothetical protein HC819_01590 [Cyclobacteriaceae bacterium]|nr:hypothetical protein [Cyclobacteriaceae bacterium]
MKEGQISTLKKEIDWHEQWSKLKESTEAAGVQLEQAINSKKAARDREDKLQQIDRVQLVRPIIERLKTTEQQIATKTAEDSRLATSLSALALKQETLDDLIRDASLEREAKIKEEEDAKPMLDTARAMDVLLSEKEEQINAANKELQTSAEKAEQLNEMLQQEQKKSTLLQEEISKLVGWKADNESRRSVAEHANVILSKLSDAGGRLESLHLYKNKISKAEAETTRNLRKKEELEKDRLSAHDLLQQKRTQRHKLQSDLAAIPISTLEKEKANLDTAIEDIISAIAQWKILHVALKDLSSLQQSYESNTANLKICQEQLAGSEKRLEAMQMQKETAKLMLEKASLAVAESVELLRDKLVSDEPCPVCGSTSHPYASEHPKLDHVLSQLEREYKQIEQEYDKVKSLCNSLSQEGTHYAKLITLQEAEIPEKRTALEKLEKTWAGFSIYTQCNNIAEEERTNWLSQHLQHQKTRQQQFNGQMKAFSELKEQLDSINAQLTGLDKQMDGFHNQIKDIDRIISSLHEQSTNDAHELQKAKTHLEQMRKTLAAHFQSEQWFDNWQADPEGFAGRIQDFAQEWNTKNTTLDECSRQKSVLEEKLNGLHEQVRSIREETNLKMQNLTKLRELCMDLNQKRNDIFDGRAVSAVEAKLKGAINTVTKILEQRKKDAEILRVKIAGNVAQSKQLQVDMASLTRQKDEAKLQLHEWLAQHNKQYGFSLNVSELMPLLEFSQEYIENERAFLRTLDDALTQAKSIMDERAKALETHTSQRLSERSLEDLTHLHSATLTSLNQNSHRVHEIDFKLKEDESNQNRIGDLLQMIAKQAAIVDNWAKLNDIIGSADGKKFRQIAQEYTLDVLLSYANAHLSVLSKRYVLQRISQTLGLQVIDQDMGDEVRTVFSLSGGESFLVSLALALGLASLSSSRMKVESLFIDEGFGSLDPATLNIAMDALERLHNQGRKVGVISHVQEMTERIPVQIKVSKQHSGKSKVEVVGL